MEAGVVGHRDAKGASLQWGRALARSAPPAVLLFASIGFRWPALVNASLVNSDAAIVGLQALHILRGEFRFLLFGSGYQTSTDSLVAAGFFVLLGATPLALMLSTLVGHVVATLLAYATLARHVSRWTAAVVVLPLVFTTPPLHTYILGPPRQAALTLVFLAIFLLDRGRWPSSSPRKSASWSFGGGFAASLACFADPYALLFLPPLLFFTLLCAIPPSGKRGWPFAARVGSGWGGALVGMVPLLLLLSTAASVHGEMTFRASVLRHNLTLLLDPCLPWVTGSMAYEPSGDAGYLPWHAGAFRLVQLAGPTLTFAIVVLGLARGRRPERSAAFSLGALGAVVMCVAVVAFLFSPMVMDLYSARYLAAVILALPFALAPHAARFGALRTGALLVPLLVSTAVSGWLGFGEEVHGARPVRLPGAGAWNERHLEDALRERGVTHAVADYWVAYRLTFLYEEAIEVVPIHAAEDRYAPYRRRFEGAEKVAYIFDPRRSRETLSDELEAIDAKHLYGTPQETLHVGDLTAVIIER
jgi:hypothetical protein